MRGISHSRTILGLYEKKNVFIYLFIYHYIILIHAPLPILHY